MTDFVIRNGIGIGTKLVLAKSVQITAESKLRMLNYGRGGLKDERILLTVTNFGKRDFTACDRHGEARYFSQKTGREGGRQMVAEVATEAQIADIMAIIDYNKKVAAIRSELDKGPGVAWDAVIELFSKLPYPFPDEITS